MPDEEGQATENLKLGLAAATQTFTKENERDGAIEALLVVIDYLKSISIGPDQYRPLFALALNLKELETPGANPSMFVTPKTHNRPVLSNTELYFRGMSAAAVDVLLLSGTKLDESCRIVTRLLSGKGYSCKSVQIKKWRERARKGHREHDQDANAYWLVRNDLTKFLNNDLLSDTPFDVAKKMVETAISWRGAKKP